MKAMHLTAVMVMSVGSWSALHEPTLREPTLHEATLHEATLHEATLHEATLHEATRHEATLDQPGVRRTELQRRDLGVPGREVIQVRVELDPGVAFGRHRHPGEEIIYVIEGSLEYEVEGKPPVTLGAGDVLFVPARTIHAARNSGRVNGAELATYIVEKGKPLVELVR